MALMLTKQVWIEELFGKYLKIAVSSIDSEYKREEDIERNKDSILETPEVKQFLEMLNGYKQKGDELVTDNLAWLLINHFQRRGPSELRHQYEITASCHNHYAPKTVAKAFISQAAVEQYGSIEEFLANHKFGHSDLVYSHHDEEITDGNLICTECNQPAELSLTSKVHELVHAVKDKRSVEEEIINAAVADLWENYEAIKNKRKIGFERFKANARRELESIFMNGNYETLYDAFEQTRFYAVILEDMVRNSGKVNLEIIRRVLYNKDFLSTLEAIIARYIEPPLLVIGTRIKGQSLADKVLLKNYEIALNKDLESGELEAFLEKRGIKPRKEYKFGLGDLIGIMAIVHGDAVTYNLRTGNYELPEEEFIAQKKVYELLGYFLGISEEEFRELSPEKTPESDKRNLRIIEIKDYIKNPRESGYRACHLILESDYFGDHIRFELQAKTNFMDTLAELTDRQNHDSRKLEQKTLVDYLVSSGKVSQKRVAIYRMLLSPNNTYK